MGPKLLVDEDSQGTVLVEKLRKAGHNVVTVNEVGLRTATDQSVLNYSVASKWILLTQNCGDFAELATALLEHGQHHPGILLIYRDNNIVKDISAAKIVKAIGNLRKLKLTDQTIVLNRYIY